MRWSVSKIVFSASTCILNSHSLREEVGYVQEQRKTFLIPTAAAVLMGRAALLAHLLFNLFAGTQIATVVALIVATAVYGVALILLGGLTEAELREVPKGTKLIALCKKLHLLR